jgi:hypothetical protein
MSETIGQSLLSIAGFRVLMCPRDGELIRDERAAVDLIGDAFGVHADVVVIPAERLGEEFFQLRTRIAGDITQKFANYRLLLVILGDISSHVAASSALQDFVRETNGGGQLWFLSGPEELDTRLSSRSNGA